MVHLAHTVDDLIKHVRGVRGNTGSLLQFGEPALGIVDAHLSHLPKHIDATDLPRTRLQSPQ